jgi:hypothetical protein
MRARLDLGLGAFLLVSATAGDVSAQTAPVRPQSAAGSAGYYRAGVKLNTAGGHTEADSSAESKEKETKGPARLPWRGTGVSWDHSATTSLLGVGQDEQSVAHEQYVQTFSAALNYFVVEQEKWSLAVAAAPSFSVELTNSSDTTTLHEPWLNDLPVNAVYRRRLYTNEEKELYTGLSLNGTVMLNA